MITRNASLRNRVGSEVVNSWWVKGTTASDAILLSAPVKGSQSRKGKGREGEWRSQ